MSKSAAKLNKPLRNRIIGSGVERTDQLLANPLNFRLHPDNQQQALAGAIDSIGFIRSVTVNKRTGRVIDGHLRVTLALRSGIEEIPVEYVDLDEAEEAQALLSLDPIAAMAGVDDEKLKELIGLVQSDDERVQEMISEMAESVTDTEDEDPYTRKIVSPVYEPSGTKPPINELCDVAKANELIEEINQADISQEEKDFLIEAAKRHIVFNYAKIADYYAQSAPEVQRLMERSALVLIDFDKAVENGFVKFTKDIAEIYEGEYDEG